MTKIRDTDYLTISARIRAMETRLLTRERMERMLEARTDEEAAKVLAECGYGELSALTHGALDEMLSAARGALYKELKGAVPQKGLVEVFQMKYDYHNAKTLIKAAAVGTEADRLLMEGGRWTAAQIKDAFQRDSLRDFTDPFRQAVTQARELLNGGGDPQLADFVLDRACYADMADIADRSGSAFLAGYVRITVDTANLRSVVRTLRMGKGTEFLTGVLFRGGNVDTGRILSAVSSGGSIEEIYTASALREAAAAGTAAIAGGRLTHFEKLCDDAVTDYLAGARYVAFGEAPLIGYLAARETELTNVRVILSGRLAGLDADTIRERLRESYV